MENSTPSQSRDFIRMIIDEDLKNGKNEGKVITRFPPEPNGYLHIGHAKSICLNFGLAREYAGTCHLRFDDTNPCKEESEYVESIKEDVRWLGFDWGEHLYYASSYFEKMYEYAVQLVRKGKAYVCDLTADQIREFRGTLTRPGEESPYRNRSMEESLSLLEEMRAGKYPDGSKTLRAKIDMSHPNLNMRDPVMYRILKVPHHQTGSAWCIYPMYDWAHGLEDSIENITHSICTLEFEDHRPLYDWFLEQLEIHHPRQIEFARLNLNYTVMSKRKLLQLVQEKKVLGWDDPRMPTISGLRRRGYTPESIREFCRKIGVAKSDSTVDIAFLEHCLREDLNQRAQRVMAVLEPVRLIIDNYPEGQVEELDAVNNPEDESMGTRKIPFCRELFIEKEDFMEIPARKFFRLSPGRTVRLRYAYYVTCESVVKDPDSGEIKEIHCTYLPETRGGWAENAPRVKATLHWVSAPHAVEAEVRLFDRLFTSENPEDTAEGESFLDKINPDSLQNLHGCKVEPFLAQAAAGDRFQFERKGYFVADRDSCQGQLIFNRTATLKDAWEKIKKRENTESAGK